MTDPYESLRRLLSDRPVAFHPELARLFGGINEALFFQQIAYWSGKGSDPEWIYKTQTELEHETCLSRYQQEQARKQLKKLGVLEDARRGVPAQLYYRINWSAVFRLLETRNLDSESPRVRETDNQDRGDVPVKIARKPQTLTAKSTYKDNGQRPVENSNDHEIIIRYVNDYARELADQAPRKSTVTRVTRLYDSVDKSLDDFLKAMIEARRRTQQHSGAIKTTPVGNSQTKPKVAYWIAVLEDLVSSSS